MKVSESRKIHIIALPHDTWKASRSDDQSAINPLQPPATATGLTVVCAIDAVAMACRLVKPCRR